MDEAAVKSTFAAFAVQVLFYTLPPYLDGAREQIKKNI